MLFLKVLQLLPAICGGAGPLCCHCGDGIRAGRLLVLLWWCGAQLKLSIIDVGCFPGCGCSLPALGICHLGPATHLQPHPPGEACTNHFDCVMEFLTPLLTPPHATLLTTLHGFPHGPRATHPARLPHSHRPALPVSTTAPTNPLRWCPPARSTTSRWCPSPLLAACCTRTSCPACPQSWSWLALAS